MTISKHQSMPLDRKPFTKEKLSRKRHVRIRPGSWMAFCLIVVSVAVAAPRWYEPETLPSDARILPMDIEAAAADWEFGDHFEITGDDLLQAPVWEYDGIRTTWIRTRTPVDGNYEVRARIRFMDTHGRTEARLAIGARGDAPDPVSDHALSLRVNRRVTMHFDTRREYYLLQTELLHDNLSRAMEPDARGNYGFSFSERFRRVSPLWEEDWRREVESAMGHLPDLTAQWMELRIACQPDGVRLYVDGMFVGETQPAGRPDGDVILRLERSVRVAALEVVPLPEAPSAFHPVAIDGRLNAASSADNATDTEFILDGGSLPPAGRGTIERIPWIFPDRREGMDHVDLSHSLFRYRNLHGHIGGQNTWPAPHVYDPARIAFQVPNRPYQRLWLVAAHDGAPHAVPVVTVRFYRDRLPGGALQGPGFPIDAATKVPAFTVTSDAQDAVRLPVRTAAGEPASLWLVPITLDAAAIASELREFETLSMELTKEVHPYRGYPDPADYGYYQGGLPSGVRVFAMTLEEAPLGMIATGNRHGNAYVAPEQPVWFVDLASRRGAVQDATVQLTVIDPYDGIAAVHERRVSVGPLDHVRVEIPLRTSWNGLHRVLTEVTVDDPAAPPPGRLRRMLGRTAPPVRLAREGTFIQLPPDERRATPETSQWGFWNWAGSHGTHADLAENYYLLRAAGARYGSRRADEDMMRAWGIRGTPALIGHDQRGAQRWAFEDPYDEEKYKQNRDLIGKRVAEQYAQNSTIPSWSMFIETSITRDLTYGIPRRYYGEDPTWTEHEAHRIRGHMIYGRAVCEGIRMHAPEAGIALAWADAPFTIPLLESGFPRELFDYIGVDVPTFERTPEMPIREVAPNRMWLLRQAMEEHGYADVPIIHTESYFPNSNPLALGHRRSADHYVRLSVLSLAMMPDSILASCFTLHDCSSRWGNQHYGEIGIVGRRPEYNPKAAFAAFATMTRLLDPGEFQAFVPTGSHSAYVLHFTSNDRHVYPAWTIRGSRNAFLELPEDAGVVMIDEAGNAFALERDPEGQRIVTLTPTPVWIVSDVEIAGVSLGATDHTFVRREHPLMETGMGGRRVTYRPENQVAPGEHHVLLDDLETVWTTRPGDYAPHAEGHWGAPRYAGPMRSETVRCDVRNATVWEIALEEPDTQRELAAWYGVFEPESPIPIPGKARALGVWADGRSNWGRIVYEIEDADGEVWRSIGTQNDWNCDDIHTWSYFNFDGWRYLEFPLPSHLPYDNFREHDTTWWGSDGDEGVVRLPLKLRRIIIEHRTHNVYADTLVDVEDRSVRLHRLKAVYDDAGSMTDAPVALQRETAGVLQARWADTAKALPNPIAELRETGVGEPPVFDSLQPPEDYDGMVTQLEISLQPVDGAREYRIYVAAYEDGSGAERIARDGEPTLTVTRLQPGFPLYLFATYMDADNKESKPSEPQRILLADDFPFR